MSGVSTRQTHENPVAICDSRTENEITNQKTCCHFLFRGANQKSEIRKRFSILCFSDFWFVFSTTRNEIATRFCFVLFLCFQIWNDKGILDSSVSWQNQKNELSNSPLIPFEPPLVGWLVVGFMAVPSIRRMILARQLRRGRQHPLLFHYHCDLRFIAQYVR